MKRGRHINTRGYAPLERVRTQYAQTYRAQFTDLSFNSRPGKDAVATQKVFLRCDTSIAEPPRKARASLGKPLVVHSRYASHVLQM